MQPASDQAKESFFSSLFDFSFKSYVTPRIIQVVFKIAVAVSALFAVVLAIAAFSTNVIAGLFVLIIVAPLLFLVYVISYRVILEVVMAVFAIAENTRPLAAPGPAPLNVQPPGGYSGGEQDAPSRQVPEHASPPVEQASEPEHSSSSAGQAAASEPSAPATASEAEGAQSGAPAEGTGAPAEGTGEPAAGTPEAGWYTDPGDSSKQRWWDGKGWTDDVRQP